MQPKFLFVDRILKQQNCIGQLIQTTATKVPIYATIRNRIWKKINTCGKSYGNTQIPFKWIDK